MMKPIPGYADKYRACHTGRIYSNLRSKYLKGTDNGKGYLRVSLMTPDGKKKYEYVHRLIAMAFWQDEDHSLTTDHINNVRDDNRPENLMFMTRGDNSRKGIYGSTLPAQQRYWV